MEVEQSFSVQAAMEECLRPSPDRERDQRNRNGSKSRPLVRRECTKSVHMVRQGETPTRPFTHKKRLILLGFLKVNR